MLQKGGRIIPKRSDITKVDTLHLMTKYAHQKMGMLRKSRRCETPNLLVCANSIKAIFIAHYFCCAAVSIGYALDFAVGTHRWTLLIVDQRLIQWKSCLRETPILFTNAHRTMEPFFSPDFEDIRLTQPEGPS